MADKLTNLLNTLAHLKRDGECEECGTVYADRAIQICTRSTPDTDGARSECGGIVFRMMPGDTIRVFDQVILGARLARDDAHARNERRDRTYASAWALGVLDGHLAREEASSGMIGVRATKAHRRWMQDHVRPALVEIARE